MRAVATILAAALVAGVTDCGAEPWPWGALVLARMDEGPNDPRLERYVADLKRVFGYRRYEIYGEAWGTAPAKCDSIVLPTKEFFVKLKPRGEGNRRLAFEFFQKNRLLVEGEAVMPISAPLFITGPEYGHGKLVMIVEIREATAKDR